MSGYIAPLEAVSRALKAMVEKEVLLLGGNTSPDRAPVKLSFEEPNEDFVSSLGGKPVINLYLYRMQEKLQNRFSEDFIRLGQSGESHLLGRRPKFVELFYAVTVWNRGQKDSSLTEQNLLSRFLQGMGRFEIINNEYIEPTGFNAEPYGLPITFFAEDPLKNQTEFWSALGTKPKPLIPLSVTVPVSVHEPIATPWVKEISRTFGTPENGKIEEAFSGLTMWGYVEDWSLLNGRYLEVVITLEENPSVVYTTDVTSGGIFRFFDNTPGTYHVSLRDKKTNKYLVLSDGATAVIKVYSSGALIPLKHDINVQFN